MITEEQLAEWERLTNDAPNGPWSVSEDECGRQDVNAPSDCSFGYHPIAVGCAAARFVAEARAAVPVLIAEVRRLRAVLSTPQVIETPANDPTHVPPAIIFSDAPVVSTPEDLAAAMGWDALEAEKFLEALGPTKPIVIYKITQTHTDEPPQSPPDSRP